jgi:hypothetical protein
LKALHNCDAEYAASFCPKEGLIKYSLAKLDAVKERPSAAKAVCLAGCNGMAEAMPLQSFQEPT